MRLNSWLEALLALSWLLFAPFLLFPVESEGSGDVFLESLLGAETRLPEDLWLQGGLASSQRLAGPCIMSNREYGLHTQNIKFLLHMMQSCLSLLYGLMADIIRGSAGLLSPNRPVGASLVQACPCPLSWGLVGLGTLLA